VELLFFPAKQESRLLMAGGALQMKRLLRPIFSFFYYLFPVSFLGAVLGAVIA